MGKKKSRKKSALQAVSRPEHVPDADRLAELVALIKPAAKVRIYSSYLFLLLLLIFARPNPLYFIVGTAFILAGSYQRIMSAGTLVKAAKDGSDMLIMTGPYSKCRHPLYFGSFLNGIGFVFLAGPLGDLIRETRDMFIGSVSLGLLPWGLVPFVIILVPVYIRMISIEEGFLSEKFGPLFKRYKGIVPCFFPRPASLGRDPNWQYDPEKVRTNREISNFTWIMVAYVLFFAKMLYFLISDIIRFSSS